jgi:hypothetical protein
MSLEMKYYTRFNILSLSKCYSLFLKEKQRMTFTKIVLPKVATDLSSMSEKIRKETRQFFHKYLAK